MMTVEAYVTEGALNRRNATGSGEYLIPLITKDYRTTTPPASNGIDPVCGMPVDPATATITLTHNGTTYAFCVPVCRKVFAEEHSPA